MVVNKWIFLALLVGSSAFSQPFVPPKNMELFGKQYTLAFQNENADVALYEYTTDNELVENWTHLITLIAYKYKMNVYQFLNATKQGVNTPYHVHFRNENNGYALLVYEPSREHLHYEADVKKSFHIEKCDGTIELQYGIRKPVFNQFSKEENQDAIKALMLQLTQDSQQIAKDQWVPTCE